MSKARSNPGGPGVAHFKLFEIINKLVDAGLTEDLVEKLHAQPTKAAYLCEHFVAGAKLIDQPTAW